MDFRTFFANLFISCGLGRIFGLGTKRNIPNRTENKSGTGDTSSEDDSQTTTPKILDAPEAKYTESGPTAEIVEYDSLGDSTDNRTQGDAITAMPSDIDDKIVGNNWQSSPTVAAASLSDDGIDKIIDVNGDSKDAKSDDAIAATSKSTVEQMPSEDRGLEPANANTNMSSREISEINSDSVIVLDQPDAVDSKPSLTITSPNLSNNVAPATYATELHPSDLLETIPETRPVNFSEDKCDLTSQSPPSMKNNISNFKNTQGDRGAPLVDPNLENVDSSLQSLKTYPESSKITSETKECTRALPDAMVTLASEDSLQLVSQESTEMTASDSPNINRQPFLGDARETTIPATSDLVMTPSTLVELRSPPESSSVLEDSKRSEILEAQNIELLQEEKVQNLVQEAITAGLEQLSNNSNDDNTPERK